MSHFDKYAHLLFKSENSMFCCEYKFWEMDFQRMCPAVEASIAGVLGILIQKFSPSPLLLQTLHFPLQILRDFENGFLHEKYLQVHSLTKSK